MLGFVNRNIKDFKNIVSLIMFCSAFARSNLKFGSLVWSCNYTTYNNELDNEKYTFLKRISYMSYILIFKGSLNPDQDHLNLNSLSVRCYLVYIMFIFDILNRIVISPHISSLFGFQIPLKHTRYFDSFVIPFYKTTSGNFSFLPRSLRSANNISTFLDCFKFIT